MAIPFFQTVKSFAQFLNNWISAGKPLVNQNTANLRAEICASCHNNKPSTEVRGGCSVCNKGANKALDSIRSTIIKNNHTPHDGKLKVCGLCGCDLRISVWIPNEVLASKEEANAWPEFCWKKAVVEGKDI